MANALIVVLLLCIVFQLMHLNEQINDFRVESIPPDENDLWNFFLEMMEEDEEMQRKILFDDEEDDE